MDSYTPNSHPSRRFRRAVAVWALIAALTGTAAAPRLLAQATEGSILGMVADPSGSAVAGASIKIISVETNFVRATVTNSAGEYVVPNLPLGWYTVSAEIAGFKRSLHPAVELTLKSRLRVDLQLEVGEVTQSVEVTAAASVLKTDSPEVSTLITQHQLESLPSQNRHFLSMAVLTPGTFRKWTAGGGDRIGDFSGGESIAVNGLGSGQNNFILDGVSNNVEHTGGLNAVPALDSIQEVSLQTNAYSAEFGRSAGAVVNVAMKSGTNQFHGFGYDYLQNDFFNARPFDFSGTNPAKQPLRKNLFGGGISGPVIHDKVFFFANYEALRQPATVIEYDTTPTALERKGDFSKSGWTVYDPATTTPAGTRTAFPGNVIPTARINPFMQQLISIFPTPNYTDPNPAVLNNYLALDRNTDAKDAFNLKGDANLTVKDTMSLRFTKQYYSKDRSGWVSDGFIGGHGSLNGTNAGFTESHTFTPSLLNEVRVGWNYVHDGNAPLNNTVIDALTQIPGGIPNPGFPAISLRNISSTKAVRPLTTLPNPYILWQNSMEYMDNVIWHKGGHAIKVGVNYNHHRNEVGGGGAAGGIKFSIDGYQTVASVGAKRPSNMTGTADGLLGLANQLTTYYTFDKTRLREDRFSAFIQDDWRVTPKLSLSLGVRYEWFPTYTIKDNKQTNFDLVTGKVLVPEESRSWVQSVLGLPNGNLPASYQYVPGDQVLPQNIGIDLSPRAGFAYLLNSRLVLRGGYGIFHTALDALSVNNTEGTPFNFQVQVTGDTANPIVIAKGFPSSGIYDTLNSNSIPPTQFQQRYHDPYVQKYGMNLQIMPFHKAVVEVGYEGNHAIRLENSTRLNYPTPGPGDLQPRRPYPAFGEGFGIEFTGYSNFNALEVTFRQQPVHGVTIYSALTVQHSYGDTYYVDPYNFAYSRGTLDIDTAHQWATSLIYDTPLLKSSRWFIKQPFGGWQATSLIQLRGGMPFSVNSSQVMNDDINGSRANLITTNGPAALPASQRNLNHWFNTAAFTTPADYTYGNSGLNILRGPGWAEVEFSLQKSFAIREGKTLTFRAEAQNLFNRVNLGQPSSTVGSAGIGTIRSLAGDPRLMQMVLKLAF